MKKSEIKELDDKGRYIVKLLNPNIMKRPTAMNNFNKADKYEEILKGNDITIANNESSVIRYICKTNNVECVVIKDISNSPTNENESTKEDSHEEQISVFLTNISIIMNKIIDNYLKNHFNYSEYKPKEVLIKR